MSGLAIVLETATTLGALSGVLLERVHPGARLFFIFAVILLLFASRCSRGVPIRSPARCCAPGAHSWGASLRLIRAIRIARSDATSTIV